MENKKNWELRGGFGSFSASYYIRIGLEVLTLPSRCFDPCMVVVLWSVLLSVMTGVPFALGGIVRLTFD